MKVPARHAAHVSPLGPEYPTLQWQSDSDTLASADTWFPPHGAHGAPVAEPYEPAAHGTQALSRAEYPTLQVQLSALVLFASEELNCGHGAHLVLLNLNVPGWQYLHTNCTLSRIWSG